MPHVSGGGDDLGSTDEVKIFKHEGEEEEEKQSSDNLEEDKIGLISRISESEGEDKSSSSTSLGGHGFGPSKGSARTEPPPVFGKPIEPLPHPAALNMGYLVSPYHYTNGAASIPASMAGKMGLGHPVPHPGSPLPFFCSNGDPLAQPPPAHMGIPPYQFDTKAPGPIGIQRAPMYPFSAGQYPYPMLGATEVTQVATWHTPMYSNIGSGYRGGYPSLPMTPNSLSSDLYRFASTGLLPHPGIPGHPGLSPHHPLMGLKQEPGLEHINSGSESNHRPLGGSDHKLIPSSSGDKSQSDAVQNNSQDKKKPHIKKPLNAFMLYMKEMRAKVVAECTLKESAAINQILGRRWHSLSREEQSKYYEKARQERQLHMQLYPGWSARDNYGYGAKKKKRKKERTPDGASNMKKCRARYGLDQQNQWCKPCRRKKKCIRYMEAVGGVHGDDHSEIDQLGSVGEADDAASPDSKASEDRAATSSSDLGALSSPGGLSLTSPGGLSSLTSPAFSLASPAMSLQSPLTPSELINSEPCKMPLPPLPLSLALPIPMTMSLPINMGMGIGMGMGMGFPGPLLAPMRNPVGTNPHDVNNPLSVDQLTGQCNSKRESKDSGHEVIRVT